jgi:agmatinase
MLTLGGDHFISYPLLKAHAKQHGALSLIHFDAHSDTWPDEEGARIDHGTMFYHAAREGLVDPARSVQVGLRTSNDDVMGFQVLDAREVHRSSPEQIAERIRARVGDHPVYLTFDIDCLDPAFAPGTGTPVPGGLSSHQAMAIMRGLKEIDFTGMDLVEVSPPYDHAETTSLAATAMMLEYLCIKAWQRGARG